MSILFPPNSRISNDGQFDTLMLSTSDRIPIVNVTALGAVPPIRGQIAFDSLTSNVYYANGTIWQIMGTGTVLAGDVTGPSNANTVVAIRNQPVTAGSVTGQLLEFTAGAPGTWAPNSATPPANGNLLMWSGTAWVPVGGTPSAGQIPLATSPTVFAWGNAPSRTQLISPISTPTWGAVGATIAADSRFVITRTILSNGDRVTSAYFYLFLTATGAPPSVMSLTAPAGTFPVADLPTPILGFVAPNAISLAGASAGLVGNAGNYIINVQTDGSIVINNETFTTIANFSNSVTYIN